MATLIAQEGIKVLIVDVPAAPQNDVCCNFAGLLSELVLFAMGDSSEVLCLACPEGLLIHVEMVPGAWQATCI